MTDPGQATQRLETTERQGPLETGKVMGLTHLSREAFLARRAEVTDPKLRAKLYGVPQTIAAWLEPYGGLSNKRVLDFGCGFGETAAGIALGHGAHSVHGVDVQDKPGQCGPILSREFGLVDLPDNLRFSRIPERGPSEPHAYDVVVSWSVLEHVARGSLSQVLAAIHDSLRPGGVAFFQIAPLYFSPEGSHLWPLGYDRWEHLLKQTSEVLEDIANCDGVGPERKARLTRLFTTLNRVTAPDLVQRCEAAGFRVLRQQRDHTNLTPPDVLLEAYALEALTTHQIVLALQRD